MGHSPYEQQRGEKRRWQSCQLCERRGSATHYLTTATADCTTEPIVLEKTETWKHCVTESHVNFFVFHVRFNIPIICQGLPTRFDFERVLHCRDSSHVTVVNRPSLNHKLRPPKGKQIGKKRAFPRLQRLLLEFDPYTLTSYLNLVWRD